MSKLPPPDADQLEASQQLASLLASRIAAAGGWIGFDAWMAAALYEPRLGYYSGGSRKFGAAGDFVTAPELSVLFGQCVAAQLGQWFGQGAPRVVYEFGAGSGLLAATLLETFSEAGLGDVHYRIVELSGELRARQHETLGARAPSALGRVAWLDRLPERLDGVVLANEVLDAMPVRLFRLQADQVLERGVACTRGPGGSGGSGEVDIFAFSDRPADPAFDAQVRAALAQSGWAGQGGWPDGFVSEIGEQAAGWVESVGQRLVRGALLLIDYGFPRAEFFHPQRSSGTLICHYRHHAHSDPFRLPGLQDITAHVDFSAVAASAQAAGLDELGYCSQANFLIACGLPERIMRQPQDDALRWARQASEVQRLVSEAEMGELFKAIAFGRGIPDDALGFRRGDRRRALLPPLDQFPSTKFPCGGTPG